MKFTTFVKIALAGTLATAISPAMAAQYPSINLSAGNFFDVRNPYVGVGYQMPFSPRWSIEPNAEYVFVNNGHMYSFNVDGRYLLNPSNPNPMSIGAGLGIVNRDLGFTDSTDAALNLTWRIDFNSYGGPVIPFIGTKAVLSNYSDFAVSFGVRFGS